MATVTAGNSFSQTIAGDQTIAISVAHNNSGRIRFVPANAEAPLLDGGTGSSFGPLPMSKTFGPWGQAGTITIFADVGTVTYTINSSAFSSIAVTGGSIDGTPIGATTTASGAFTSLNATSYSQSSGSFSAIGSGAKTLTTTGAGNLAVGAVGTGALSLQRVGSLTVISSDSSGTPGNATNNNLSGRAAFAAAASTLVITNSQVTAASKVFVQVNGNDTTLKYVTVSAGAGTFTVTGNAAATATTVFDFLVVN